MKAFQFVAAQKLAELRVLATFEERYVVVIGFQCGRNHLHNYSRRRLRNLVTARTGVCKIRNLV
jgi:hypothetical protein